MEKKVRVDMRITEHMKEQFLKIAEREKRTVTDLVLASVREHADNVYTSMFLLKRLIPDISKAKFDLLGETVGVNEYKKYWDFVRENR